MSTNNRIVCIVDDEQEITMYFRDALQVINGISISTFTDPILALEHFTINKSAYALVLADLRMSSLNGIDLIKKIKDLNPIVRTILMTGWAIDNNLFIEYAKRKIINAFLQKPIRLNSLREEVNGQLQTYQLQKLFYLLESYKISTISSVWIMLKSNSLPISYLSKNLIHFLFPVLSKSFKRNLSLISLDATVNRLVKSQF